MSGGCQDQALVVPVHPQKGPAQNPVLPAASLRGQRPQQSHQPAPVDCCCVSCTQPAPPKREERCRTGTRGRH
eukprot:2215811-Rhodomonas_salina.1